MNISRIASALALIAPLAVAPCALAQTKTSPTTAPAVSADDFKKRFPDIRKLLSDPDPSQRQAGQKMLDALSAAQLPVLIELAGAETDPEVHAHLEQTINDLSTYVLMDPKPLSLNLKDVPIEQICDEITKQLGDSFQVSPNRISGNYSVQADGLTLWETIHGIQGNPLVDLNYSYSIQNTSGKFKMDLVTRSQDRAILDVGCFRLRPSLTLAGDECAINIECVVDPRLRVAQYSNVIVDSLIGQDGKAHPVAAVASSADMTSMVRADYFWYSKSSFLIPKDIGNINELRGHINVALLEKEDALKINFSNDFPSVETSRGKVTIEKMTAGHYLIHFPSQKPNPALAIPPAPILTYMRVLDNTGKETHTQTLGGDGITLTAYALKDPPARAEIFWPQTLGATSIPFVIKDFNPRIVTPNKSTWDYPDAITKSTDIEFLEKIASSFEAGKALNPKDGLIGKSSRDLRTAAYARLGEIGTPQALAAIARVEDRIIKAGKQNILPATVPLGLWQFPTAGTSPAEVKPLVTAVAPDKTSYAIISQTFFFGATDLFLVSSKTPDDPKSWSRPVLLPTSNPPIGTSFRDVKLNVDAQGALTLEYNEMDSKKNVQPRALSARLAEIYLDSDKDGWTDLEEKRLGLDPSKADTDGDGIADGQDACPDFAAPSDADKDPNLEIIQKSFLAAFGFSESRTVVIVSPNSPKIHLKGYAGPILYNTQNPPSNQPQATPRFIQVNWGIPEIIGDTATVHIGSYTGPMSATGQTTILKKINGQWIVVSHKLTMIS